MKEEKVKIMAYLPPTVARDLKFLAIVKEKDMSQIITESLQTYIEANRADLPIMPTNK